MIDLIFSSEVRLELPRFIPLWRNDDIVARASTDDLSYDLISEFTWHLGYNGYAFKYAGYKKIEYMHRLIMSPKKVEEVDHINRDKLDNRRSNLRVVLRSQNGQNLPGWKNSSSQFRGVSYVRQTGKWRAYAKLNYKYIHLGTFVLEEEAAAAASKFRRQNMKYAVD